MSDKAQKLKGFRDYPPALMAARWAIMDIIRHEAALGGFQAIGTPAIEYVTTLLGSGGEETDKQVYRWIDKGDREIALRFDLTVPFARFVGEHLNDLPMPFKRLQIGDVWRGENPQKGRYREFTQCDIDIIGADSIAADVEVLSTFYRILSRLPASPKFTVHVGCRPVLSAVLRKADPALTAEGEVKCLIAIDKLAKIGREKVAVLLDAALAPNTSSEVLDLLLSSVDDGTDLKRVRTFLNGTEPALAALDRFERTVAILRATTAGSSGKFRTDLSTARGLGYYTGVVFETTLDDLPAFGSIGSGGRYNDLASRFTSRELPGVGGSVGLDRLVAAYEELNLLSTAKTQTAPLTFVAVATEDATPYAFDIVGRLRAAGLPADIGMTPKLGNQFKHADRLGAIAVITVGTSEMQTRTCAIKVLGTGQETKGVPVASVVQSIQKLHM